MSQTLYQGSFKLNNINNNNEKSQFKKYFKNIKISIFGVFYILIKNFNPNLSIIIILSIIENLQLFVFSFHPLLISSWSDSKTIKNLYKILNKLEIIYYFNNNLTSYLCVYYIIMFIIFTVLINFIYVAYSFNRGFFSMMWLVHLLKYVLYCLITIFFLPILRLYISIFSCNSNNYNVIVNSMKCYSGFHYIHFFMGIFGIIALIIICFITSTLFYNNYLYLSLDDKQNRIYDIQINSHHLIFKLFIKIYFSVLFTFIEKKNNISYIFQWIIILSMNILSINYFIYLYYNNIYYANKNMQLFHSTTSLLFSWTYLCMAFSKVFVFIYNFKGGVYILFSGYLLIIFIMITNPKYDNELNIILFNIYKENNCFELIFKLKKLLDLFSNYQKNKKYLKILQIFQIKHKDYCILKNCPIETINFNNSEQKNIQTNKILFHYLNRVYQISISKFPTNINLRLEYVNFLYVFFKQRFKALKEIELLENNENLKNNFSFEQEFIIFKTKKIILDEQLINNVYEFSLNESNIAFDSHYKQCQNIILIVSRLFLDFWGLLSNRKITPDIYRLNNLGEKINDCIKNIDEHFNRMQHYNPNNIKALKLYSSFVGQILNNHERAKEIMLLGKGNNPQNNINNQDNENLEVLFKDELIQGSGIIYISSEKENFGTIVKTSANVTKIFGYILNEIIGKNIEEFFIKGYNGYILYYIKEKIKEIDLLNNNSINNLLNNNNNLNSTEQDANKIFYCNFRNSHIIPVNLILLQKTIINEKNHIIIKINLVNEFINNEVFLGDNIENIKNFENNAIFIVDSKLKIISYNDEANVLLGMTKGKYEIENISLVSYFPEFLDKKIRYEKKKNYTILDTDFLLLIQSEGEQEYRIKMNKKLNKNLPGSFNFFESNIQINESPLLVVVNINLLDDLKLINTKKHLEELEFNKNSSYEESKNNSSNNVIFKTSLHLNNNLNNSSEEYIQDYDEEFEKIKDYKFIVNIRYSYSNKIQISNCINSKGKFENIHNYTDDKIDSPFLTINIDKILDEIEDLKRNDEKEKEFLTNISTGININNLNNNTNNNNISNNNIIDMKINSTNILETNNKTRNRNIMSYLKSKGKFVQLYDFEGLDFMKDFVRNEKFTNKTLHELKMMNLKTQNIKKIEKRNSLTNSKEDEINFINNENDKNEISKKKKFIRTRSKNNKQFKEEDSKINDQKEINNEYSSNSFSNEEEIEILNITKDEISDTKLLLNIQSDLKLKKFKENLDNLKNYSEGVIYFVFQKNKFIQIQNPPTQISLFLQIQEATSRGDNIKLKQLKMSSIFEEDVETKEKDESNVSKSFSKKKSGMNNSNLLKMGITNDLINKSNQRNNQKDKHKTLNSLIRLKIVSLISFLILIGCNVFNFIIDNQTNNKTKNTIILIHHSYNAINEITYSSYLLRNLLLIQNKSYINFLFEENYQQFLNLNINSMSNISIKLDYIINNFSESKIKLLDEHSSLFESPLIKEYYLNENGEILSIEKRTLIELLRDMRIYILTIANFPDISLNNNTLVNNLIYNTFNDFYIYLSQNAAYFSDLNIHNNKYHKLIFTISFSVIFLISLSMCIIIIKMYILIDLDKIKIFCAFYEIPLEYINDLSKMCIKFIEKNEKAISLILENEDSNINNRDIMEEEAEEELLDNKTDLIDSYHKLDGDKIKTQKRIREIKKINNTKNKYKIFQVSLFFLIIVCIFLFDYVTNFKLFNKMDEIIDSFNNTALTISLYTYSLNIVREKIINQSFITQNTNSTMILNKTFELNYIVNSDLLIKLISTSFFFTEDFRQFLIQIQNKNICNYLTLNNCSNNIEGISNYGIEIVTIKFFEILRISTMEYIQSETLIEYNFILSDYLMTSLTEILQYYIKPIYEELIEIMLNEIINILDKKFDFSTILFSIFLVFLIITYCIIWIPVLTGLDQEIKRTKKMLNIIPNEILDKIESLKNENKEEIN